MSVILNALRAKENERAMEGRKWPKQGLYIDDSHSDSKKGAWLAILIILLFSALVFGVVRLTALYFSSPPGGMQALPAALATNEIDKESELVTENQNQVKVVNLEEVPKVVTEKKERAELKLAKELFSQKRFQESISLYEKLVKADPANAVLLNDLGYVLMKTNKELEAESRLLNAIAVDPNCAECYNNLGLLSTQMGRIGDAMKYLKRAIAINEIYPEPHFNLAVLLQKSGDRSAARLHFMDFLKWTPNQSSPVAQRVRSLLESQGDQS